IFAAANPKCVMISRKTKGTSRLWQDIACQKNTMYALETAIKTQQIAPGGAYIEAYGVKTSGKYGKLLGASSRLKGNNDWTGTKVVINSGPYDKIRIYIRVQNALGKAWFKNIRCLVSRNSELKNNNFTEVSDNKFAHWKQDDSGLTIFAEDNPKSVMISRKNDGTSRLWQTISCQPDTPYSLTADIKTQGVCRKAGGAYCGAYIEAYGMKENGNIGKVLGLSRRIKGDNSWVEAGTYVNSESYNKIRIYIRLHNASGKAWFKNINCISQNLFLRNVLYTKHSPIVITNVDKSITYKAKSDYEIIPGKTKYPYDVHNAPWNIGLPKGSRIKNGQTVLVSYNYAFSKTKTYCPSEPRVYKILGEAIRKTVSLFHPEYIHIGHDEPQLMNRDSRCKKRGLSNARLLALDLIKIDKIAKNADTKVRLMMWADAVDPDFNASRLKLGQAIKDIPKDVIMCCWWYKAKAEDVAKEQKMLAYFGRKGFSTFCSPCGYNLRNSYDWANICREENRKTGKCMGIIYTSWDNTWRGLSTTAEYGWSVSKPEFK
ncbi:MAG: family 20 glycosylhydrolase, partial [Victivallaceae bacterium]